jgi:hypothetical protein
MILRLTGALVTFLALAGGNRPMTQPPRILGALRRGLLAVLSPADFKVHRFLGGSSYLVALIFIRE